LESLQGPRFINVDLEVWSDSDLAAFEEAVRPIAFVLYAGKIRRRFLVSLEAHLRKTSSPENTIWGLLKIVGGLPPAARKAWKAARSRIFDVGYQGGEFITQLRERPVGSGRWYAANPRRAARPCQTSFSPKLLAAVAEVGGTIATTIYPPAREVPSRRKTPIRRPRP
jgi:hypothetical protein